MKAKNSKEVALNYLLFVATMVITIGVGFFGIWAFFETADREVALMEVRSREYDAAFARQITLTERVDSLWSNILLLNSGRRLNEAVLQSRISTQKMNLLGTVEGMKKDALLYDRLSGRINSLLQTKDSIRLVGSQVEQIKDELRRCIDDNRRATRKMIFQAPYNPQ